MNQLWKIRNLQHNPWTGYSGQYLPAQSIIPARIRAATSSPPVQQETERFEQNKRHKSSAEEKAKEKREVNNLRARQTRLRKKLKIKMLQEKLEELQNEQKKLKQALNDRKTANLLLVMSASPHGCNTQLLDMEIINDIDLSTTTSSSNGDFDSGQLTQDDCDFSDSCESNDLICDTTETKDLPTSKMHLPESLFLKQNEIHSESNLDLKFLKKHRKFCTPQELEFVRRERNRIQAKQTREKKKIHIEKTEMIISRYEEENEKLKDSIHRLESLCLIISVPHSTEINSHVVGAQLLMNMMKDPQGGCSTAPDVGDKVSDTTQSDTNSESESNRSVEPRSSSSNENGSFRSDDSNSIDS